MSDAKNHTLGIRLSDNLYKQVRTASEERQWSMNVLVRRAIEDYVKRLVPISEIRYVKEADSE